MVVFIEWGTTDLSMLQVIGSALFNVFQGNLEGVGTSNAIKIFGGYKL